MANQTPLYIANLVTALTDAGWEKQADNTVNTVVCNEVVTVAIAGMHGVTPEFNCGLGEINHFSNPVSSDAALKNLSAIVTLRHRNPDLYKKLQRLVPYLPFQVLADAQDGNQLANIVICTAAGYIRFGSACQRGMANSITLLVMVQ